MDEQQQEKLKTVLEEITKVEKTALVENLLQNNSIEFEHESVKYKIAPPTYDQRQDANKERVKKYQELLKDPTYLMEEDLIKAYAARGIDIKQMEKDIVALEKSRDGLMLKLGEALKEDRQSDLDAYKTEIESLNDQIQKIALKKVMLLETSVESQVMVHIYTYMSYLCTMKKDGENWVRAYNSFDAFKVISNELMNLTVFYASFVVRNDLKL